MASRSDAELAREKASWIDEATPLHGLLLRLADQSEALRELVAAAQDDEGSERYYAALARAKEVLGE